MDSIWPALLAHFEARPGYFQLFDRYRMRPDRQGCDVWFSTGDSEYWLAVKGLITSYAGAPPGARTTLLSIEEVAREMDKLRGLSMLSGGKAALVLAAFPFGTHELERNEWQGQMLRFEAKKFELAWSRTIQLRADREARVYVFI